MLPISLTQKISTWISSVWDRSQPSMLDPIMDWLDRREITIVKRQAEIASRPWLRPLAVMINHLSNGWIFAAYGVALLIYQGRSALSIIFTALVALGISHAVYPLIKAYLRRQRPMEREYGLQSLVPPLDRYSCPSGHCMTATALSIPVAFAVPAVAPVLIGVLLVIGWARIAAAHHYPSDLLLGSLLGSAVAWPITSLCLS